MVSIITELLYIFVWGPAKARLRVHDFPTVLRPIGGLPWLLLFGRVVVSLTQCPYPLSILFHSSKIFDKSGFISGAATFIRLFF